MVSRAIDANGESDKDHTHIEGEKECEWNLCRAAFKCSVMVGVGKNALSFMSDSFKFMNEIYAFCLIAWS